MSTTGALRGRRGIAFWVVAAACLVAAHDLVYLVQLGPGRALADTLRVAGHGYWPMLSGAIAAGAVALVARTAWRLHRLRRRARGLRGPTAPRRGIGPVVRTWSRLLVVVGLAFVVQENAEHFVSHNHAPLLGALGGPEYPLALPVLAAITLVGALLASLVREREQVLLARIAAGAAWSARHPAPFVRRPLRTRPPRLDPMPARPDLSRAPPLSVSPA
jgi:hypothetical protein